MILRQVLDLSLLALNQGYASQLHVASSIESCACSIIPKSLSVQTQAVPKLITGMLLSAWNSLKLSPQMA